MQLFCISRFYMFFTIKLNKKSSSEILDFGTRLKGENKYVEYKFNKSNNLLVYQVIDEKIVIYIPFHNSESISMRCSLPRVSRGVRITPIILKSYLDDNSR
ncbi:hypothetical protein Xsto_00026 [Xenorhabdus stockiae]|uniref:Uncharacterized protein n=1 Tax=Xenorhabdus stockiae TaxID=351614 RepID=A0A2D0KWZ7_9GAMM|nr:hypothetical protein Xsto_00026 [Xenorhabdus stockiae]